MGDSRQRIDPNDIRVFSGESNPQLATAIAERLGVELAPTHFTRFSNDNLEVQLGDSVRGRSVFVVQSLTQPVSEHLLQL
ncbi:MAG: ribose-phosphate pyrophosphokinase-like domain-containing protein, partial [Anaerolineae bacterium]